MVIVFLANGFEETEAIFPIDIMRRGGINVKTVSIYDTKEVKSAREIVVKADLSLNELDLTDVDCVMLPGGMPGTTNLDGCPKVHEALRTVYEKGGYLTAICAAPMILGKDGYLNSKNATCYPGFEKYLKGAKVGGKVVVDGKVITAAAAGYAMEFGLAIVKELKGEAEAEKIKNAICV